MSDNNVVKGPFPPADPPSKVRLSPGIVQEVEHRDDGPWLVVYAFGKKMGEVPIEPGTEPQIKRAKVLPLEARRQVETLHDPTDEL